MPSLSAEVDLVEPRALSIKSRKLAGSENADVRSETSTFQNGLVKPPVQGRPTAVKSGAAWDGAEFRSEEQYTYVLSKAEVREIEAALKSFKALGLDGQSIARANFPLPGLSKRIQALTEDLHFGRGFFALRGLNPNSYSREDNILLFLGISAYVGEKRGIQDDKGHIFAHIREAKYMQEAQDERPIRDSNVASAFHADLFCDILAMQTRSCAMSGGNHIIASTAKVYEELLRLRPDLVPVLAAANWPFDTRGSITPPDMRPLLYYKDQRVMMNFVRDPLAGLSWIVRTPGLPRLTPIQVEALDMVQAIAETHHLALKMQPGDLTFVNNFGTLHAREAFQDSDTQSRYLVRMWLKNAELAWDLPAELAAGNARVFDNEEIDEDWNIVYKPRLLFHIAERMTP